MLAEFESNITKNQLFTKKDKLLVAVSGGVDSVVLAHLLKKGGYDFRLAHCNFKLRGKDSEKDEQFCRNLAEKLETKIFVQEPDVKKYCAENGASVQMAARELRYQWFDSLVKKEKLDFILTAHHASDVVETVLINLLRGTGIAGLKGIPRKNGKTIRPLLTFSREEIETFAKKEKIKYRTDKSNLEDKYERNYLRLKIIPKLKKINPSLEQTFLKNCRHFSDEATIVRDYIGDRIKELVTEKKDCWRAERKGLAGENHLETLLYYWLSPFEFTETQCQNMKAILTKKTTETKYFLSPTHKVIISRDELLLTPNKKSDRLEIKIDSFEELKQVDLFNLTLEKKFVIPEKKELFLSEKSLRFPLLIRHPLPGDKFKPFGMKGFKLLSDFMKDEKMNPMEKEDVRVLVNGNGNIIWVIGYRSDERFRIDKNEKRFLRLSLK